MFFIQTEMLLLVLLLLVRVKLRVSALGMCRGDCLLLLRLLMRAKLLLKLRSHKFRPLWDVWRP